MRKSSTVCHPRRFRNSPSSAMFMLDDSGELKIRSFSPDDLEAVLKIQNACKAIAVWRARDYERLAGDASGTILVAEFEQRMPPEVVGFLTSYRVDSEAELWNIAVAPAHRRRGVARALLEEAFQRLSGAGARRLYLEVRESNLPALKLYQSLDFARLARRKDYYQNPKEDALVLVRKLVRSEA